MAITPARQRNAVSEGIALGLLVSGRDSLPYDKVRLDLAFEGAWRSWSPYRDRFRQVTTDVAKGSGARVMTRADRQKQVWALYWDNDGAELRIRARQPDWSADNPEDVDFALRVIDGDVPVSGWQQLAGEFLRRFDR